MAEKKKIFVSRPEDRLPEPGRQVRRSIYFFEALFLFLLGAAFGVGGAWLYRTGRLDPALQNTLPAAHRADHGSSPVAPLSAAAPVEPGNPAESVRPEEPPAATAAPGGAGTWDEADFRAGAQAYNHAIELLQKNPNQRLTYEETMEVNQACQLAIRKFEAVSNRAPAGIPIGRYLRDCTRMIDTARIRGMTR